MAKFKPAPKAPDRNTITRAATGWPAVPKSKQSRNPAGLPDGILQAYGGHPPGAGRPRPASATVPKAPEKQAGSSKSKGDY